MSNVLQSVTNFLVPATGSTNAYAVSQVFSATPTFVDFNNVALDGLPFRPSGVLIDNSQGTGPLTVLINEISYAMTCAAGELLNMPYPAPVNHTANITGNGQATVIFVDYPVIPFYSASAGSSGGGGPLPVTGPLTDAQLRAAPVSVELASSTVPLTDAQLRAAPVSVELASSTYYADMWVAQAQDAVPAGAFSVSLTNIGAAPALVANGSLPPGVGVNFEAPAGSVLGQIEVDATGTSLLISTVRS